MWRTKKRVLVRRSLLLSAHVKPSKRSVSDQQLIDTTSTTANARAPITSPSTSTVQLNDEPNQILSPSPSTEFDRGFELLSQETGSSLSPDSHADQVQANVLVVVQDGSQQSGNNPYLNPNYNRQPWGQPCVVSPYYPYACNYSPTSYQPASRSVPSYAHARVATGPQLVPPTPPCYYNCYPRLAGSYPTQTGGYPLARSVQPSSALTNNYLLYITI